MNETEVKYPIHILHSTVRCFEAILDLDFSVIPLYKQNMLELKNYLQSLESSTSYPSENVPSTELLEQKAQLEREILEKDMHIQNLIERLRLLQMTLDFMEPDKEV